MSMANSKETASYHAGSSFNTPKHTHTHQKDVGGGLLQSMMERDAELLFPRPEHRKVTMDPSLNMDPPTPCMAGICREEELPAGFGMGNPPPAFKPQCQSHETTQQLKGVGFFALCQGK